MPKNIISLLFILLTATAGFSQNPASDKRSPLDPTVWGVVYDIPATKSVKVTPNVPYSGKLTIDVYTPPDMKQGDKRPAVIFLNGIGDRPDGKLKDWEIYKTYPRLIAAHGIIGISMEASGAQIQENFRALFAFLEKDGAKHGIDAARLGVYAASANTTQSLIYLMSENSSKGIRAAALFYGATPAPQTKMRTDLPVLYILAEGDLAGSFGQQSANLWQRVRESRAPWTLVFASRQPHAFDAFQDTDESRRLIQQTIAFWKSHLEPVPPPDWKPSEARAIIASTYADNPQLTADLLAKYTAQNPNDMQGFVYFARALQALQKYDEALTAFEKAAKIAPGYPTPLIGIGQIRFAQKRYDEAAAFLQKGIDNGFRNSMLYGQLAFSQLSLGKNEEAIKSYEKVFEMGIPAGADTRGAAYFNMARAYARLKQPDKTFEFLNKAIDEGVKDRSAFENDEDLAAVRSDTRFQMILERLKS